MSDDVEFLTVLRWTKVERVSDPDQSKDDKIERVGNRTSVG